MSDNVVIYHANCYDGVTAAYVTWLKLGYTDPKFIPMNYSDSPPDVKDKQVYIIDFSFKRPIMEQLIQDAEYVTVLDHHKTAEAELRDISSPKATIVFDMERSGAGIAWDYFNRDFPRSELVNYIEDRDLWRFKLPNSKEVNAWIQSFDINLETWIKEVGREFNLDRARSEGISLRRLEDKYVKQICANVRLKRIGEYLAPYVQTSILMSEVCDYLIKNYEGGAYPFAFYSFQRKDGKYQYGLRSRSDFDVSVIAKSFGGGGHKQAAGFELDYEL